MNFTDMNGAPTFGFQNANGMGPIGHGPVYNGFGQPCSIPAYGSQNVQFNQNGADTGPNGYGPASNNGFGPRINSGYNRRASKHPAVRNNNGMGRRTQRSSNWKQGKYQQQTDNWTGNQFLTQLQPQSQNPNGVRRTANAPARNGHRNNRRFSSIPFRNRGFPTGHRGRRALAGPWDGDIIMADAPRIKKSGHRSFGGVTMVDAPAVMQPILDEDVAMQEAPPLLEDHPVFQCQPDLERQLLLDFERQLVLERQNEKEVLAQGVLMMQRLVASIFHLALDGNNNAGVTTPDAMFTAQMAGLSLA